MSKVVVSLPEGMVKGNVIGAVISMGCYVLLQFLVALLICEELMEEEMLYPLVCLTAGISSFAGCWCSTVCTKGGRGLGAVTVVVVFLALTLLTGFLFGDAGVIGDGLVGVGAAMSVGGIIAAVVCGMNRRKVRGRREKRRKQYDRR